MHLETIIRDLHWTKGRYTTDDDTDKDKLKQHFWKFSAFFGITTVFSLLHCAAFCGAMYISLETVFNGQYELASPLPICAIIFTVFYGLTELIAGLHATLKAICGMDIFKFIFASDDKLSKTITFANRIGMAGMIACAVAGVVEYCNSNAQAPCMLQTLAEKTHLSPEAVCGIIAGAVIVLLGLYIAALHGQYKTIHENATVQLRLSNMLENEVKGFAPCCC